MFHMHDIGWGWWLIMSVGMAAFWVLVIYGISLLVRDAGQRQPPPERPEQILAQRLASGEISIEEYEQLRSALERGPRDRSSEAPWPRSHSASSPHGAAT